jgi:sec-independent protein translocase protein TatB
MLQGGEIIIILLLALVVLGPKRLPEMARKIGEWTAELRSAAREVRSGLEAEVAELKEVQDDLKGITGELKAPLDDLKKTAGDVQKSVDGAASGNEWTGPKPVSGPTPDDAMADLREIEQAAREAEEE